MLDAYLRVVLVLGDLILVTDLVEEWEMPAWKQVFCIVASLVYMNFAFICS
jgi:hypothetical protein